MAVTIPEEFDSPVGQLSGYTAIKSGRYARLTSVAAFVNETAPSPDETSYLLPQLANKHVDIRSFIASDPEHSRPVSQMNLLHMMENAYHQSLNSIGSAITGGHFNLTWEEPGNTAEEAVTHPGTPAPVIITSPNIPYNVTGNDLREILEAWIPEVIDSLDTDPVRPAVLVTGNTFPYIITFQDETQPPPVRQIGSWVPLFGVDDSGLTSGGTAELSVTNLRTDTDWIHAADDPGHLTIAELESVAGSIQEAWATVAGATGITSFVVGKDTARNNWRSGVVTFNGSNVAATFVSRTPLTPVNIAQLNSNPANTFISFVMPEYATISTHLSLANCYIQMTSDPQGLFSNEGGSGTDSTQVIFNGNVTGVQFRKALSSFAGTADYSRITAVRIKLSNNAGTPSAPSAATKLTFMALRALDTNWVAKEMDINTRTERLESPVSLTGAAGDSGLALVSPLIRSANPTVPGDTTHVSVNSGPDPTLADGTVSIKFNTGTPIQVAGTEPTNHIILYLRQRANADGSWDWIHVQLSWGRVTVSGSPVYKTFVGHTKATKSAALANSYTDTAVVDITDMADEQEHLLSANVDNDVLTIKLASIDAAGSATVIYDSGPIESTNFERIRGRVGWYAQFDTDKDIAIDYVRTSNISFATLRTAVFYSHTPIDGAQLFADASGPSQLYDSIELSNDPTDDTLTTDTAKKLSATSSYRFTGGGLSTYAGIQTNVVDFDDWTEMFIDFDGWFPATFAAHNSIQAITIEPTGSMSGTFKLTHDGAETSAIPYNATALQVQTALEALGTIGAGNVVCTQGPLGTGGPPNSVIVKFVGVLAGADVSTLVVSNDSVTNGTPVVTQVGVRPKIYLKEEGSEGDYTVGTIGPFNIHFVPGTWSHVHLDLAFLAQVPVGRYRLQVVTDTPTTQSWWIDNIEIGHRSIAWELRAIADGTWHRFLDTVNDPRGALHLPPTGYGRAIQLQARALRADAWVSAYTLKPHYRELGRIVPVPHQPMLDDGTVRLVSVISGVEIKAP